ncbi:hypothetical protein EG68_11848 [Paragonimus skrjabini miyazakii]|uniref:Uncharacterized protein n=1 Tax=Paragonimus skrjabini miyazakii TaxID=59628 RepID=A0A8S9YT51_9TREM|nr:hypothetical protein EG68_11848 [Paragonimus skrjabini miyazakii]
MFLDTTIFDVCVAAHKVRFNQETFIEQSLSVTADFWRRMKLQLRVLLPPEHSYSGVQILGSTEITILFKTLISSLNI